MSILGHPVLRREDQRFLTGGGSYIANLGVPDCGAVHYVRSHTAHARLVSVDVSRARAAPGVRLVVTGDELDLPPFPHINPAYPAAMARPLLARDVVRFVGEPVAAIVADNAYLAADAAELVEVHDEPLPPLVDPAEAQRDDVVLFPDAGTNEVFRTEAATPLADFAACEVVVRQRLINQRIAGAPIEGRAGLAYWDEAGRLVHHSSCQGAHPARAVLQKIYGLTEDEVRVVVPDVGGGFGSKARPYPEELLLGELARRSGRPVTWVETRTEDMVGLGQARGQVQDVAIGGTRDGVITAYQLEVLQDSGAYPLIAAFLPVMTQRMAAGVYRLDNVGYRATSVATTTTPMTAFRGAGRPEAAAAIERAVDLFAAEVGLDPAEVRRRNLLDRFDEPRTTAVGTTYDCGDYPSALRRVLDAAGYDELRAIQARRRQAGEGQLMGIGIACYVEITAGAGGFEHGIVELRPDGGARVVTGTTPNGQGHVTSWAMVVADRTGIPMERIEVVHGDTDVVPGSAITGGSRSAQVAGAGLARASAKLVDAARSRAAELLEANPEDVVLDRDGGRFHVAGTPAKHVDWAAIGGMGAEGGEPLSGANDWTAPQPTFPFGAHVAVVEVDRDTGAVTLQRLVACDDAGTILNPILVEGQVHGGLAAGAAQALLEEVRYDTAGNPLTATFADYGVASAAELPSFERVVLETPTWVNELGAKGIGESGTIGATPAVQNAVVDALAHLGVRHIDLPCTPERVWRALRGVGAA